MAVGKPSVRLRAVLPIAGTFAVLALFEYLYFPARSHELQLAALNAKAVAISELTANSAAAALEFDDRELLAELARAAAGDADLAYLGVFDARGGLVHGLDRVGGLDLARLPHAARATTTQLDRASHLHVVTPIPQTAGPAGSLIAGFSMRQVDAAKRESERIALAIALAIFALGLAVALSIGGAMRRLELLAAENRVARQRAEAANLAKSAFLANISHEIRTPLNGVLGLTEVLLRAELPGKERRLIETVARSGRHLLAIVNDVLDFSKIEAGKLELHVAPFHARELIERVVENARVRATAKGLSLRTEIDAALPSALRGDALRLEQVLTNLAHNAVKFTEQGGVVIHVEHEAKGDARVRLRIRVVDTGIGISPEQQRTLFQAFVQADDSMTRTHGGTGLGLAISKQLTELMGGQIGLESTPGQGSTFWLELELERAAELPSAVAADSAPEPRAPVTARPVTPAAQGAAGRLRVLAAEDNAINQEVLQELVEHIGWSLTLVDHGEAAVAALSAPHSYDAVLMDCQMPVMDGYAATRAIRALEQERGASPIPIVAVTAHALSGERERVLEAGMNGFVTKPIDEALLKSTVEQLVRGLAARRAC